MSKIYNGTKIIVSLRKKTKILSLLMIGIL